MWMLVLPNITHITLFPLNTAVWLCISCFRIWLDWSYGALSNISEVLKITWMLHKIILNIALARQLTTIYTVTMLFSHVSSYEVELCVNPNLLKGDESLIFTKCVVYWDGLFHFVVRSCLVRFSAWELTNSTRAWAGEFWGPVLHWRHFLCQLHDRDGKTKYQRVPGSRNSRTVSCTKAQAAMINTILVF